MQRSLRAVFVGTVLLTLAYGCGARSGLRSGRPSSVGDGGSGGQGGTGGEGGAGGTGGEGGSGGAPVSCVDGIERGCGTDVGECAFGTELCAGGVWSECMGGVVPRPEECNGKDDDCDGETDEDFGLGAACDGPDGDVCNDDVMTCGGCSPGPTNLETCNGKDDNCNGVVDSDCDSGGCKPSLLVTGSTPSDPNCIDFPVEKGSTGAIQYPCSGGMVTAQLGSLKFSGTVKDGKVSLTAVATYVGPDKCTWQTDHAITGYLPDGKLSYGYKEKPISGTNCWNPCTEVGTVEVSW